MILSRRGTVAALLALGLGMVPAAIPAASPIVLNVISLPSDTAGQVYYAQELGYFKDAGLDVHITDMTSSPAIVSAVVSGAADIGFSVVGSAAVARQRGILVKFVAPGALYLASNPTAQLVAAKDTTFRSAAELSGKTIAVTGLADLTYYGTRAWIDKNGGNAAAVKFVELPFPEMEGAVVEHRVDAAALAQPFVSVAAPNVRFVAPYDDAVAARFLSTGWIATDAWLATHADAAARFAAVMRRTAEWANTHQQASGQILLQHVKITPAVAATMNRVQYATVLDPALVQPPLDVASKYGSQPLAVTVADLIWTAPK